MIRFGVHSLDSSRTDKSSSFRVITKVLESFQIMMFLQILTTWET